MKCLKTVLCKAAACVTALSVILSSMPAFAAWDGYIEKDTGKGSDEVVLVNMNNIGNVYRSGAVPDERYSARGGYTAHWKDHTTTGILKFNTEERDWSKCATINFSVYSEKATGGKIAFFVYCDYVPAPGKTMSYQMKTFNLDWVGMKEFSWSLDEFTVGNQADFAKVQRMEFIANGWGCAPDENSDIYISTVRGVLAEEETENVAASMSVSSKEKTAVYEALDDSVAVMNFNTNMLKDKTVSAYGTSAITTAGGVSMAPASFFEKALGVKSVVTDGALTLSKGDVSVRVSSDLKKLTKSMAEIKPEAELFQKDGEIYLPLVQTSTALGFNASTKELLTVIGSAESVLKFFDDDTLAANAKIMLSATSITDENLTDADWKAIKTKWKKYIVGDETMDITNEYVKSKLTSIDKNCKSSWNQMNKKADATVLFGTRDVAATADMNTQYLRMLDMAVAYGTYGSEYYQNSKLRKDILYSMEWLYKHYYGQAEIDGTGWRDTGLFNWSDWYVTTPGYLMHTILILEDYLTQEKIDKYLSLYNHLRGEMRTGKTSDNAASRVYNGTLCAVLQKDAQRMTNMTDDYNLLLVPAKSGDLGVQEDSLYITHNHLPYTSAYGTGSLLERVVVVGSILSGTKFEFATPYKYNMCTWMYEMFEPIMVNSGLMSAFAGRAPGMEQVYGTYVINAAINLLGAFGKDDDEKLLQIIKRGATDHIKSVMLNYMDAPRLSAVTQIMADDSITVEPYNRAKVYYSGDRIVLQRDGFAIALAMNSSRTPKYESLNGAHMDGWYTGDGMVYTYIEGDYDAFSSTYWKNANPYHRGGTTVDTQEREAVSVTFGKEYYGNADFVGGVEFDKLYAVAAMDHEDFTNLVQGTTSTDEYGGDLEVHQSSLRAKKSWFMFDDEVVALGADINADDGFDVHTVIENRKLNKNEELLNVESSVNKEYKVVSISASGDDGNVPENLIDDDYETRWSLEGTSGSTVTLELENAVPVGYVGIAQYNGTGGKQAIFDIEVSNDGVNFTQVFTGKASGQTVSMEPYACGGVTAKYVRYNGHGRTNSSWNSVTEIKVFPPTKDGSMPVDGELTSNKRLGTENIIVDGVMMEKQNTYEKQFTNPKWIHVENVGGYVMPEGGNVSMSKKAGILSFIEFWFEHGVSPKGAKYSYILLPTKSVDETKAYSENPHISILSNTASVQAVRENNLNLTGVVFWEAGSFENITSSQPIIAMMQQKDGELTIGISDPTHKLDKATVSLSNIGELISADKRISVSGNTLEIDFSGSNGRTLTASFEIN